MPSIHQSALRNRLLSNLSAEDFALLADSLVQTDLPRGKVISETDAPILYVLFPENGVISLVVQSTESQSVEGGIVGYEGFVSPAVLLGTDRIPYRVDVQIPGYGYQIEIAAFLRAVDQSITMRTTFLRFAQCLSIQSSFTASSNALHPVEERLGRWLLMCHDRLDSDDLPLTHKFMAVMLGVRRASVTVALQSLEGYGFLLADRGFVILRNRAGLEQFAGDAYGRPEAEYERLIGTHQIKLGLISGK